jgi:hypothetical protein
MQVYVALYVLLDPAFELQPNLSRHLHHFYSIAAVLESEDHQRRASVETGHPCFLQKKASIDQLEFHMIGFSRSYLPKFEVELALADNAHREPRKPCHPGDLQLEVAMLAVAGVASGHMGGSVVSMLHLTSVGHL